MVSKERWGVVVLGWKGIGGGESKGIFEGQLDTIKVTRLDLAIAVIFLKYFFLVLIPFKI